MSALANPTPVLAVAGHTYHANAFAFRASLQAPIQRTIEEQALVDLPSSGGYRFSTAEHREIDGILAHGGGYAQVAGYKNAEGGSVTLATAVLEGLNILDVLTADRIVAQITTEHAANSSVPSVSFLGTRFENLRIAGEKIEIEPYHDILGAKPDKDESYLNDHGVLSRISQQYSKIRSVIGVPQWASDQFSWDPTASDREVVKCSLVKSVSGAPGKSFGHVIDLPFFGRIFLAELTVKHVKPAPARGDRVSAGPRLEMAAGDSSSSSTSSSSSSGTQLTLTMITAQLNGGANGTVTGAEADPNGTGSGGGNTGSGH